MPDQLQLVNYCHSRCRPLMNIMRLPEKEAFALAKRLADENPETTAFYRFVDFANYYPRRLETDRLLRAMFIELGGRPAEEHPLSFVLQGSDYLDGWFDHGIVTRLPLACVPADQISFTLGDSMAMLAREGHVSMLTRDMLEKEIAAHPQGAEGWLREMQDRYRYIEVQLWDDGACRFSELTQALSLGSLTAPPKRLSGGYSHRMYRLDTTQGCYAVKLLNPEIVQRPDALGNYASAEALEGLLEAQGLPVLPALTIGGRKLQYVDGQYLYVFDYFPGRVLRDDEITPEHCGQMGRVLARIHGLDRREMQDGEAPAPICWTQLADDLQTASDAQAEASLLWDSLPMLERVAAAAEDAARRLPRVEALCHNDMDAKNVLWQGEDFRIIDLECLGYADPLQEMLDLAVSWAGWPAEEERFKAFIRAYCEAGGAQAADPALLYDSRRNHIDWLAYNARRALLADPEERRIGREQVTETIGKISSDQRCRAQILQWVKEVYG